MLLNHNGLVLIASPTGSLQYRLTRLLPNLHLNLCLSFLLFFRLSYYNREEGRRQEFMGPYMQEEYLQGLEAEELALARQWEERQPQRVQINIAIYDVFPKSKGITTNHRMGFVFYEGDDIERFLQDTAPNSWGGQRLWTLACDLPS